jgi:hypothetical protein
LKIARLEGETLMSGDQTPIWVQVVIPALTAASAALGAMVVSQYQKAKSAREVSVAKEMS